MVKGNKNNREIQKKQIQTSMTMRDQLPVHCQEAKVNFQQAPLCRAFCDTKKSLIVTLFVQPSL